MTLYPNQFDSDNEIPVVDDNVTEWSGEPHNKAREAIIAIEQTLGINPHGLAGTVADRINVSLDEAGQLRSSAIATLGLFTNIMDSQVDAAANISESKLNLAHKTYDLKTMIDALSSNVSGMDTMVDYLNADLSNHVVGLDNRHTADQIDTNVILLDKLGASYSALNVMTALIAINDNLIGHETSTSGQHVASAISVDSSNFTVIPKTNINVQSVLQAIDGLGTSMFGEFGATLNSNGIPRVAVTNDMIASDGYDTFLLSNTILPVETIVSSTINDVVTFLTSTTPTVTANELDRLFSSISVGDYITINYGGYVATFTINSILFEPQITWQVKIDGVNLANNPASAPGYAYIEQKKADDNVFGNLAVCQANHDLWGGSSLYQLVPCSLIVVPPRSAQVLGMDLNLADLDSTHYALYIDFYPSGNVSDKFRLPGIDVTGNKGTTPGTYTLDGVITNVNNGFRAAGFNYRMVAFERLGQFGLAIGDTYGNPGFSICSGVISSGVLTVDSASTNNVIGNDRGDLKDALGLGNKKANVASPVYSATEAAIPTKIIVGKKNKKFNVFGKITDELKLDVTANADGYWVADIESQSKNSDSIETTYSINKSLAFSKIKPGSTIVVLPAIEITDTDYNKFDYGRFFVKEVVLSGCEPNIITKITTINSVSIKGLPKENSSTIGLPVRIYHGEDSVTLDVKNLVDIGVVNPSKRLHEIYVNSNGETAAYERVRLSISVNELLYSTVNKTYGWHITNVSPKFKGYVDSTRKNRRFATINITNYNSVDKSFEIQLRDMSSSLRTAGPITLGRKNETLRVYDNTGVDYIDINCSDSVSEPFDLTGMTPIEFEVFLTESTNDEFMCLASCEQLYLNATNGTIVSFVKDRRQFGTVNERVLSDSAISFIESNNRLLHENSIINGFKYNNLFESEALRFTGGSANVNGKIIHKNAIDFIPFPIAESGTSNSSRDVVLCLDEKGNVWWAPLTSDGSFAIIDAPVTLTLSTPLQAYPFEYIVNNRKDLVPFAVVTLTSKISGTTPIIVGTPIHKDVRKFLREAQPNVVSVTGEILGTNNNSQITGNFASLKAAIEYAYQARLSRPKIVIKGVVELNEEIILTDTILEGGAYNLVKVTNSSAKISILGNTTITGVNFQREYTSTETVVTSSGKATIATIATTANTYRNIKIENCTFSTADTFGAGQVPHILMEQADGGGATIKDVTIHNNTFNETECQLTIALVSRNSGTASGTVFNGVTISENKSNHLSYIIIGSDSVYNLDERIGLQAYGIKIINNMFGFLWLNASSFSWLGVKSANGLETSNFSTNPLIRDLVATSGEVIDFKNFYTMQPDIVISNNTFVAIQPRAINNAFMYGGGSDMRATPSMFICGNQGIAIGVSLKGKLNSTSAGEVIICNNRLQSSSIDPDLFYPPSTPIDIGINSIMPVAAITVYGSLDSCPNGSVVNIHSNSICNPGRTETGRNNLYNTGITANIPVKIHNNIIDSCFSSSGINISYYLALAANSVTASITNNIISRGTNVVDKYIGIDYADCIRAIQITDNVFDSDTNGTDENLILVTGNTSDIERLNAKKIRITRNINQKFAMDLLPYVSDNLLYVKNQFNDDLGWVHSTQYQNSEFRSIVCTMIALPFVDVTAEPYIINPLVVNVPYVDNALPIKISFKINGISPTTRQVYIRAFTLDSPTESWHNFHQDLPIGPLDNFELHDNLVDAEFEIDLESLVNNDNFVTRKNVFPVFICLYSAAGQTTSFIQIEKDSGITSQIYITEMSATYKY